MKLFICPKCNDVVAMRFNLRKCECGSTSGKYLVDGDNVQVTKGAAVIGMNNQEIAIAYTNRNQRDPKKRNFSAWIFNDNYHKINWKL